MKKKSYSSQQKTQTQTISPRIAMCPACDWKTKVDSETVDKTTYFFVICRDCGLSQNRRKHISEESAIEAWNDSCKKLR